MAGQPLMCRSLSSASNSHSIISSELSSLLLLPEPESNLSSSAVTSDTLSFLFEIFSCLFFCVSENWLEEGDEFLSDNGDCGLRVGVSTLKVGLSMDSYSSFIFARPSNSSLTLSISFLDHVPFQQDQVNVLHRSARKRRKKIRKHKSKDSAHL